MKKQLTLRSVLLLAFAVIFFLCFYRWNNTTLIFDDPYRYDKSYSTLSKTGYIIDIEKTSLYTSILLGMTKSQTDLNNFLQAKEEGKIPLIYLYDEYNIFPMYFSLPTNEKTDQLKIKDNVTAFYKRKPMLATSLQYPQSEPATKLIIHN